MTFSIALCPWRSVRALSLALLGCLGPFGCRATDPGPTLGSNSNWLVACSNQADCESTLSCHCQVCTAACEGDADCAAIPGTHCAKVSESTVQAMCGDASLGAVAGVCLTDCSPGGCAPTEACLLGDCVPQAIGAVASCADLPERSSAARTLVDELFEVVQQQRTDGTLSCGGTSAGALPLVRVDARLSCAAQTLAADLAATLNLSLTDSKGGTTVTRLNVVGYTSRIWAEGFSVDVTEPAASLNAMLSDSDFCAGFSNAGLRDIGIGISGTTYVVTLASQ